MFLSECGYWPLSISPGPFWIFRWPLLKLTALSFVTVMPEQSASDGGKYMKACIILAAALAVASPSLATARGKSAAAPKAAATTQTTSTKRGTGGVGAGKAEFDAFAKSPTHPTGNSVGV